MLAYHNDPKLKARVLRKVRAHQRADRIIQGVYWEQDDDDNVWRGCAVGCLLNDSEGGHERYETELGIPVQLAWLEDAIFEALPIKKAVEWPVRFLVAIPVGADLAWVWPRFAAAVITDIAVTLPEGEAREACEMVAYAYRRIAAGETIGDAEAARITLSVWEARATWEARVVRAAWAARDAWAVRDAWASRGALEAWAAWPVWAAGVPAAADKLDELLEGAPVA